MLSQNKTAFPAKAGIHPSSTRSVDRWVPAFAGKAGYSDRAKRPAEQRVGLGVPTFKLAHAAVDPDEEHLLLLLLEIFGEGRLHQASQAKRADGRVLMTASSNAAGIVVTDARGHVAAHSTPDQLPSLQ